MPENRERPAPSWVQLALVFFRVDLWGMDKKASRQALGAFSKFG